MISVIAHRTVILIITSICILITFSNFKIITILLTGIVYHIILFTTGLIILRTISIVITIIIMALIACVYLMVFIRAAVRVQAAGTMHS